MSNSNKIFNVEEVTGRELVFQFFIGVMDTDVLDFITY